MNKTDLKYYLLPVGYISGLLAIEFFPNISGLVILLSLVSSVIGLVALIINRRHRAIRQRLALVALILIPVIDLSFGLSNKLRDELKGPIVLSVIDKSFVSTIALTVRRKETKLVGVYDNSVAGFGDAELAEVWINGDTISFKLIDRKYEDILIFDRSENLMRSINSNSNFRILTNQLIK
jgi:hypothetical protein